MKNPILSAVAFFTTLTTLSVGYAALSGGLTASDKVSSNAQLSSVSWNRIVDGILDLDARTKDIWNGTSVTIASAVSIPTTTWTLVNWNAEEFDDQNLHDNSTNSSRITIVNTGRYRVTTSACFSSVDNWWYGVDIFKNGVSLSKGSIFIAAGGTTYGATMQCANSSFSANFSSGDYLQTKVMIGVWAARNLLPGYSFFQVEQIK